MVFNTLILKYNGKELQETGMYSYGWRQYMPDLGRWNGIDQLAESYLSTSPYAYVANNPISNTDPDGRWINEDGSIRPSTTFDYMPGSYKPMYSFSASTGMSYNSESGGGGGYTPFGQTKAYADLMDAFYNGGTGELVNQNGTLKWWTDYEDPDPTVKGIGNFDMLKLKDNGNNYDYWGILNNASTAPSCAKSPDFEQIINVIPIQYAPKSGDFGEQGKYSHSK